jgi:hypothetical protein
LTEANRLKAPNRDGRKRIPGKKSGKGFFDNQVGSTKGNEGEIRERND